MSGNIFPQITRSLLSEDDGGYSFPYLSGGLTLRQLYAFGAMQGIIANLGDSVSKHEAGYIASKAFEIADAMVRIEL